MTKESTKQVEIDLHFTAFKARFLLLQNSLYSPDWRSLHSLNKIVVQDAFEHVHLQQLLILNKLRLQLTIRRHYEESSCRVLVEIEMHSFWSNVELSLVFWVGQWLLERKSIFRWDSVLVLVRVDCFQVREVEILFNWFYFDLDVVSFIFSCLFLALDEEDIAILFTIRTNLFFDLLSGSSEYLLIVYLRCQLRSDL